MNGNDAGRLDGPVAAEAPGPVGGAPRRWVPPALAFLTGVLYGLLFPPYSADLLAWVFLVPLLLALDRTTPRWGLLLAFGAFLIGQLISIHWVDHCLRSYTSMPRVLSLLLLCLMASAVALFYVLFAWLQRRFRSLGFPVVLAAPLAWVAAEALREPLTRFPWNYLGYSLYPNVLVRQGADLLGVHGLSFLAVLVNAAVYEALSQIIRRRRGETISNKERRRANLGLGAAAALLLGVLVYGQVRLAQAKEAYSSKEEVAVGLAQGNIDQAMKWNPDLQDETLKIYLDLTDRAADMGAKLVVWPEAAAPFFVRFDGPRFERILRESQKLNLPILFGAPDFEKPDKYYNSAFLLEPEPPRIQKYDKILLVPFGEYVPFKSILFFVDRIAQGAEGNGTPGEEQVLFTSPAGELATLICYEGVFPGFVRDFVDRGADLLVNITNDAWFGRTGAPYQHLVMEAFRAVENRIYMVRAANTGVSAAVTPWGEIRNATGIYEKAVTMVWVEPKKGRMTSPYQLAGNVLPPLCWLAASGLLLWPLVRRIRRRLGGRTE